MTGEAAHNLARAGEETPSFAQACAEARSQASSARRPGLVAGAVFGLFLSFGAVLTVITEAAGLFLLCLIFGVLAALLMSLLVRIRERSRAWSGVRLTFRQAVSRVRPSSQSALFSQLDNVVRLVSLMKEEAAYFSEITGETIDYWVALARLTPDWALRESETYSVVCALEDDARAAEAIFIHLQEGLIPDADRVASSHEVLSGLLASAEGKALFLESVLVTERAAMEELNECVGYLRRIVGASRDTAKKETEQFDSRRRVLRGEAFAVMRRWIARDPNSAL